MTPDLSLSAFHPGLSSYRALLTDVETLYQWLDAQLAQCRAAGQCRACGACCDFEAFGHRLYLTTPELLYFAHHIGRPLEPMTGGVCPYRIDGRCGVYARRFSGCRIFQCSSSASAQSDLTEQTLARLKGLCRTHNVPYHYIDLKTALQSL